MSDELAKLQGTPRELARWQKAQQQLMSKRYAAAVIAYRDFVIKFPGVSQLWFEFGMAAMGELEFDEADKAFYRTMELSQKDSQMLLLLAQQYQRLRRLDRVRHCFQLAAAADPASARPQINLALWHEKDRQLDAAWDCIEACLTAHPRDGHALYVKAVLLHRKGRNAEAETLLRDLNDREIREAHVRISSHYLLAEILDETGRYAEAWRQLMDAKELQRKTTNTIQLQQDYDRASVRRREQLAALTSGMVQRWKNDYPPGTAPCRLTLLGGHPRSGTTLLESILGSHPEIHVFDEPLAFVTEIWNKLAPMNNSHTLTLNELDSLSANHRADLRRRYLKSLLREVEGRCDEKMLLVKNPSPTMALHLWLRIFPELKVIIALRDPRDVLISCLFQNLALTPVNVNFLSLERAAKHYADLMDVWLRLRDLGGFDWIQVRYRDVVANLAGEGRRVTEFLQLSWREQQEKFHEAAARKFLFSPTYQDVTRPLQHRSVDRWENYAAELEPLQQRLAPYCREFGFAVG